MKRHGKQGRLGTLFHMFIVAFSCIPWHRYHSTVSCIQLHGRGITVPILSDLVCSCCDTDVASYSDTDDLG